MLNRGQSLGDVVDDYQPDEDDEDDEDHKLSAATVRELHFGGGLVKKTSAESGDERPK